MATQSMAGLLGPEDPAPVVTHNTDRRSPFLLIGDHAGFSIPARLGRLGVSAADLQRHIACDIGVRRLGEKLSQRTGATFIHQYYSRLVVDCNRHPDSPEAIPTESDGTAIPGNEGLTDADRAARIAEIHSVYQHAIAAEIDARQASGQPTILISLHSFTPTLGHQPPRPWHIGLLYGGGDTDFARHMLDALGLEPRLIVGDNEPYRMDETDYTVPLHAFAAKLPYVEIEVRQDLIGGDAGQDHWCELIAAAANTALSMMPDT